MADADPPILKAVLFADLAQYSRLTAAGEQAALELVTRCFSLFQENAQSWRGEFIKSTGDGVLLLFDSVSDALSYALEVQEKLGVLASVEAAAGRFRIGVHAGEVRRRAGDVYGHAVNLAARVQTLAVPGGICATDEVYQAARSTAAFSFRFAGRHALKNMPGSIPLYHVAPAHGSAPDADPQQHTIAVIDGLTILDARGEPVVLRSRTAQAMIGYLSLAPRRRELRDKIATLLWSDRTQAEARAALNRNLRIAGKALTGGLQNAALQRGGHAGLDEARYVVDIQRILSDLELGQIDNVLLDRPDWPEAILHGFDSISSLYGTWVKVTRHNRRENVLHLLEHLLDRFESQDPLVRRAATAVLVLENSHEGAVRCLMRHYAAVHNPAAALRTYENLRRTLRDRYGLEPDAETAAFASGLSGQVQPRTSKRPRENGPPLIASGAFNSADEAVAAQASGFRAELVANLSKFRELTVVDLQGSKENEGFEYIFTAESRREGAENWLFAVLEDSAASRVVWSNTYRFSLEQWLSVQRQLVGRIASHVEIYISHDRLTGALRKLPEDLGVYDAWLRGEHLLSRWSIESEDQAERLFEHAISRDPNFAPAHASLASVYNSRQFIRPGLPRRPANGERALDLARRAVELDPLDARNLLVVAWSAAMVDRFAQAEFYFELAAELNPNHPKVLVSAALGLAFMGRIDFAGQLLERAKALKGLLPAYQWSHIATIRFLAGDYEGTVEAADRSDDVIVDTPGWKAAALSMLGRTDECRVALGQLTRSIQNAWAGPATPTWDEIVSWFLNAFPIRHDHQKERLANALRDRNL